MKTPKASPEPIPGMFLDNCGTRYRATKVPKIGWWIQREGTRPSESFPYPDFPTAVQDGLFIPETI